MNMPNARSHCPYRITLSTFMVQGALAQQPAPADDAADGFQTGGPHVGIRLRFEPGTDGGQGLGSLFELRNSAGSVVLLGFEADAGGSEVSGFILGSLLRGNRFPRRTVETIEPGRV